MISLNIYTYSNYRKFIKDYFEFKKSIDRSFTYGKICDAIGMQRTYLSHVIAGRGDLSEDQLYGLSEKMDLSEEEERYFQLLLSIEKCGVWTRKEKLIQKQKELSTTNLKSENALKEDSLQGAKLEEYYYDPLAPVVHMYLMIPKFSKKPSLVSELLGIPGERLVSIIQNLTKMGLIESSKDGYIVHESNVHLSESHPLSQHHGNNLRHMGITARGLQRKTDYFFSATICSDETAKAMVKAELLKTLEICSKKIEKSKNERIFHLNIDLFD